VACTLDLLNCLLVRVSPTSPLLVYYCRTYFKFVDCYYRTLLFCIKLWILRCAAIRSGWLLEPKRTMCTFFDRPRPGVCVFITAGPRTKLFTWGGGEVSKNGVQEKIFVCALKKKKHFPPLDVSHDEAMMRWGRMDA
jgi:hypothetical protein